MACLTKFGNSKQARCTPRFQYRVCDSITSARRTSKQSCGRRSLLANAQVHDPLGLGGFGVVVDAPQGGYRQAEVAEQ